MNEKTGELINIVWDGPPDGYYIKGHVTIQDAINALRAYDGEEREYPNASIRHLWFKWVKCCEEDVPEGCGRLIFRTSNTERKGWSKATRFDYSDGGQGYEHYDM